jgi:hypothetical protein
MNFDCWSVLGEDQLLGRDNATIRASPNYETIVDGCCRATADVCLTSTPAGRNAQIAVIARRIVKGTFRP